MNKIYQQRIFFIRIPTWGVNWFTYIEIGMEVLMKNELENAKCSEKFFYKNRQLGGGGDGGIITFAS